MTRTDLSAAKAFLTELRGGAARMPVLVAVSGGLDSMCLLTLLNDWGRAQGFAVTAAHFNHRLRGEESDRDEAFVRDWCAAHAVPFVSGQGDVRTLAAERGLSLEEAAREARYAFLRTEKTRRNCAWILTAHHADDSAETMLLNLLRGTGLRGLCGIPAVREDIARPFLQVTQVELAAYAAENGIPHVEDSTNALDDAARNVLRHQVLPILKELNPRAVENMARTAALLRQDEEALTDAAMRIPGMETVCPGSAVRLQCSDLNGASAAVRNRAVLAALAAVGGHEKDLIARHVEAVCGLLGTGTTGRELSLPYGVKVMREADALRFVRSEAPPEPQCIAPGETVLFGNWRVTLAVDRGNDGIAVSFPEKAALRVSLWEPRDRLNGRTLKRLWADRGVAPTVRDTLPVLRVDGQAVVAAGLRVRDEKFAPGLHEQAARVIFYNIEEKEQ